MISILVIAIVGVLAFVGTAFDPALEMWAPLIVSVVPLLIVMMWPVRSDVAASDHSRRKAAA